MKLAFPVNEGWLFSKDKHHVKVFASYDKDADTNEITFGDRTMIPWACVKKMTKIGLMDEAEFLVLTDISEEEVQHFKGENNMTKKKKKKIVKKKKKKTKKKRK